MNTSQRYQLWPQIWLCFSICFVGLSTIVFSCLGVHEAGVGEPQLSLGNLSPEGWST